MEGRDIQPVLAQARYHDPGPNEGRDERTTRGNRRPRGFAMIWAAIWLLVLIGVVGLSLDWGKITLNVHQLQNAADAGALAGAQFVKFDHNDALWHAKDIGERNYADRLSVFLHNEQSDPNRDVVIGYWVRQTRTFRVYDALDPRPTNAVMVLARRQGRDITEDPCVPLIFGRVFDRRAARASRTATAWSIGSTGSGIIVLAEDPRVFPGWNHATGLLMDGGTIVDLRGPNGTVGDIQINSTSMDTTWASFRLSGSSADIWAGEFFAAGTTRPDPNNTVAWESLYADPDYPFSVNPKSPEVPDPLAGIREPNIANMPIPLDAGGRPYLYTITDAVVAAAGGQLVLTPGYYPYGIDLRNQGNIVLTGGPNAIYAFGGGTSRNQPTGLILHGGSLRTREGEGAMIYVTGDPGGSRRPPGAIVYGKIDITATATVEICSRGDAMDPPQKDGEMGIAIWQDRNDHNYGKMLGNSSSSVTGVIYCGYNAMEVGGTASHMGNQLIAGALWLHGTVSLGIAYDERNTIEGYRSVLVKVKTVE